MFCRWESGYKEAMNKNIEDVTCPLSDIYMTLA